MKIFRHVILLFPVLLLYTFGWTQNLLTRKKYTIDSREKSIPLPNRSIYVERGVVGSLAFGVFLAKGNWYKDSFLLQWQGEGSYFYTKNISGGLSAKIIAGEPDSAAQVENRYVGFIRIHKCFSNLGLYAGPFAGIYNLEFSTDDPQRNDIQLTLLDYGLESGIGWKFIPLVGGTLGIQAEQVLYPKSLFDVILRERDKINISESLFRVLIGINLDLREIWPQLKTICKGAYLSVEWQYSFISDLDFPIRKNDNVFMIGSSTAF